MWMTAGTLVRLLVSMRLFSMSIDRYISILSFSSSRYKERKRAGVVKVMRQELAYYLSVQEEALGFHRGDLDFVLFNVFSSLASSL
ncbi:hypothetical protein CSUI_009891 [Cystoisospora suis]|uniref:Uncharacterized protein n=1 Tax=Cystoisospora suis TaxID=483139 RepID=A0A2C6KIH5_9APIC|nr:hypothetical protein CSUI_009891 [Cystoisospora suis]